MNKEHLERGVFCFDFLLILWDYLTKEENNKMDNTLFPEEILPEYLFDLKYEGPSFDGKMEIGVLVNEIAGLKEIIKIASSTLLRNKKINFGPDDIDIFIEAFEKGSFKKRVKLVLKDLNECQGAIALASLIISVIILIQQNNPNELKDMSPQLISQISDPVKIELLQNKTFLSNTSNVIMPLGVEGDQLLIGAPKNDTTIIKYSDKSKFSGLVEEVKDETDLNGYVDEVLVGRINRVDLDATKRHIGFKVNSEGNSMPATLSDESKSAVNIRDLLGQIVEIESRTSFKNGLRDHLEIKNLKIIKQKKMNF